MKREAELDGLRAVAAVMVLLFHCLSAVGATPEVHAALMRGWPAALSNGASAVVLFFVLSGYVLSGSFLGNASAAGTGGFLLRRMLRLYPAYLLALALAWGVSLVAPLLGDDAGQSAWLRAHVQLQLSAGQLLRSALLPGAAYGLVPVGWTLRLELVYSLIFPLLMLAASRVHVGALVALAAASLLVTPDRLVNYAFPFSVGIAMYRYRERIASLATVASGPRWACLVLALAAFALPPTWLWPQSRLAGMGLATAASAVLIALAPLAPMRSLLNAAPLRALGEASYSLYLLHVPVVLVAAPLLLGDQPAPDVGTAVFRWAMVAAVVLPVTWLAAAASYRTIERPAIEAGRRLSARAAALR